MKVQNISINNYQKRQQNFTSINILSVKNGAMSKFRYTTTSDLEECSKLLLQKSGLSEDIEAIDIAKKAVSDIITTYNSHRNWHFDLGVSMESPNEIKLSDLSNSDRFVVVTWNKLNNFKKKPISIIGKFIQSIKNASEDKHFSDNLKGACNTLLGDSYKESHNFLFS